MLCKKKLTSRKEVLRSLRLLARVPQPASLKLCQEPAVIQALHSLVTEKLGLSGHVKLALVPACERGHMYVTPLAVVFSVLQNPTSV